MKLLSVELELKTILSICQSPDSLASILLGRVSDEHFFYEPTRAAYRRLSSLVRTKGTIPDYSEICADPVIPEDNRQILLASKQREAQSKEKLDSMVSALEKYRKLRLLFHNAEKTIEALTEKKLDLDIILEKNSRALMRARSTGSEHHLLHFGRENNSSRVVKALLSNDRAPLVPTGFRTFDKRNGGIFQGSLMTIASTTGGGKTTLAGQLLINMTLAGHDCALVPLEMSEEESTARLMSSLSGVEVTKYMLRKVTKRENRKTTRAYRKYVDALRASETRYSIFKPQEDLTVEEILFILKPYGYQVIIIDYISLLKGVDGDDSWQQLGKVARFCKIFAETHKIIIVLLAQLNKEGEIRYARSIVEHSNNAWFWVMTDENRETGILDIRQAKARNQDPFSFQLAQDFKRMRVRDLKAGEAQELATDEGEKKRQNLDTYLEDISDGDEGED